MADVMKFDAGNLIAELENLGKSAGAVVRPSAQTGAQILYDEVKSRVPVLTGLLSDSIYQVYSQDNSKQEVSATYHVSWNKKKAPHGHLVENGTSRMPAKPFIRPAYDAMHTKAEGAVKDKFENLMQSEIDKAKA